MVAACIDAGAPPCMACEMLLLCTQRRDPACLGNHRHRIGLPCVTQCRGFSWALPHTLRGRALLHGGLLLGSQGLTKRVDLQRV